MNDEVMLVGFAVDSKSMYSWNVLKGGGGGGGGATVAELFPIPTSEFTCSLTISAVCCCPSIASSENV